MFLVKSAQRKRMSSNPASYPVSITILCPKVQRPGHEADHPQPSAEVKNVWSYTLTPNRKETVVKCYSTRRAVRAWPPQVTTCSVS